MTVTSDTAFKATVGVTAITLASHVLGLARESSMAACFGAGGVTDAYFVALMVPNMISVVLANGIQTVGISVLGEYIYQKEKSAQLQTVVWSIFHLVLACVSLLSVAIAVVVPMCIPWMSPGFTPEQQKLAGDLIRILAPVTVFISLSGWCQGVLQISQQFTRPAVSNIFFNAVMIAAILASGWTGGIIGVAGGMLAATAVQFFFQFPAARRVLPAYRFVLDRSHPAVKLMRLQMIPVGLRMVAQMANAVVERLLASRLVAGSISALEFANRTFQLPISAIGNPVVTVLYSAMTAILAGGDADRYKRAFVRGMRMLALIFIPISVGLIVFREDIIRILFERGEFDRRASELTAVALAWYSLGLLFTVWRSLAIQALAARQDFMTPLWATLAAVAANVGFNVALVPYMAHGGIALGKTLSEVVWLSILLVQLRRRLGPLGGMEILRSCAIISVSSVSAGALVHGLRYAPACEAYWHSLESWAWANLGTHTGILLGITARLAILGAIYAGLFILLTKILRVQERKELSELIRNLISKKGSGSR